MNKIYICVEDEHGKDDNFFDDIEDAIAYLEGKKERNRCGKPHNNGGETCPECEVIKHNI